MKRQSLKKFIFAGALVASLTSFAACYYYPDDSYHRDYAYRRDYYGDRYYRDGDWRDRDGYRTYWYGEPRYRRGDRVYHED